MQHWKEDFMFGYQFLNGCNPVLISRCTKLPDNFPVTNDLVSVSLERGLTLEQEIEVGLFLFLLFFVFFVQPKAFPKPKDSRVYSHDDKESCKSPANVAWRMA